MYRTFGGRSGRASRVAANVACIAARFAGPSRIPNSSRSWRWQRREREPRDALQDRAPLGLGRRVVEELGDLASGLGHQQLAAVDHAGHVRAELGNRRRDDLARDLDELGGEHLLLVEPLTSGVVQLPDRQLFEQQRRVHQARVHPEQQVRIERVVRLAGDLIDALDPRVDVVDAICGDVRFGLGTERDGVREDQRALQPLPRVPFVEPRLSSAGDHQRMRGLHQHRASPAEQDRNLPMDLPTDAARSEVAEIAVAAHHVTVSAAARTTLDRLSRSDGVAVRRRHTWTGPRVSSAAGSPIPGVPGSARSGPVPAPGSLSEGAGDGSC